MHKYVWCLLVLAQAISAQELAPCPASPNCVSSLTAASDKQHAIAPFVLALPADEAWPKIRDAVASSARTVIVSEADGYLHAEATSRIFRFVDDLELRLDSSAQRVNVRSASRTGYGDLGVNRKRVEALRDQLQAQGVIAKP